MSNRSNLVQKTITDKNGVKTTRWVKANPQNTAGRNAIPSPAPVVSTVPESASPETLKRAVDLVVEFLTDPDETQAFIDEVSGEAMAGLMSYPSGVAEDVLIESSRQLDRMWCLKAMLDERAPAGEIRDYLNLFNHVTDNHIEEPGYVSEVVNDTVSSYAGLEPLPLTGEYPEKRRKQIAGLLHGYKVLVALIDEDKVDSGLLVHGVRRHISLITDRRLVSLFIDRPDDAEQVIAFMEERKTADYNRIVEMLASDSPAIASGEL